MKISKVLLPIALLFTMPLAACTSAQTNNGTPIPSGGQTNQDGSGSDQGGKQQGGSGDQCGNKQGGSGDQGSGDSEQSGNVLHDIDDIVAAFEEEFDCEFEYDLDYFAYMGWYDSSLGLKAAITDAINRVDFVTVDGEPETYDDGELSGYEVYFYNDDETVEIDVYSFDYEGTQVGISIYEIDDSDYVDGETFTSWSDINIASYVGVDVPGPDDATEFDVVAEEGWVDIYAYGCDMDAYVDKLEKNDYYIDEDYAEWGMYFADDPSEEVELMIMEEDDGSVYICIYTLEEE